MIERVEIGKPTELTNGTRVIIEELNSTEKNPNQGRVALAEAAHVVVDPDNVIYVDGNMTRIKRQNPVQAAAHHGDGDSHDRLITEASGASYDLASISADAILATRQDQVVAVAGEINKRGGRISGEQAKDVIERVESPLLRITAITTDGETHSSVEKHSKTQEVVIVDFMGEEREGNADDSKQSSIIEFPGKPEFQNELDEEKVAA